MKLAITVLIIALTALSVLGQSQQQPPAVRIVTEDPNLPSDLYYGNTRVKPLRIRPGTNRRVTIDDNDFFLQQHFVDFYFRMPDAATYNPLLTKLNNCAPGNTSCDRIAASQSFFQSVAFQGRGILVYRLFVTSFGRKPRYAEFVPNLRLIAPYQTPQQLEASYAAYLNSWVNKPTFRAKYPASMSAAAYVDALSAAAKVTLANRNTLVSDLQAGRTNRTQVLRTISESNEVNNKYFNEAYVALGYFGYFKRDPDANFTKWLAALNTSHNYRTVTNNFLSSPLYRNRF